MISVTDYDVSLIKVLLKDNKETYKRWDILYKNVAKAGAEEKFSLYFNYNGSDSKFDGGLLTTGVRTGSTDKSFKSNRSSLCILLNEKSSEQAEFIFKIGKTVEKLNELLGANAKVKDPIVKYGDADNKSLALWCRFVESNDGRMYTKAYDASDKKLDVKELKDRMIIRPLLSFAVSFTRMHGFKLQVTINEFCMISKANSIAWSVLSPKAVDNDEEF